MQPPGPSLRGCRGRPIRSDVVTEASLFGSDEVGAAPTLTVGELSARIAQFTAKAFPADLWVEGQIRNLSRSAAGHVYFDLAEPTPSGQTPRAQISVTLLAPERKHVNEQLKRAGGAVRMEDGIEVRLNGRLRWYTPRGTLQLKMHGIDPAFTLGRLQVDRERVLAGLTADGLLRANGAVPMALVPLRIGLVTSRGTAAHADVLAELTASALAFTVREVDARTQGSSCEPSVTKALRRLAHEKVDVILLVRGGGARTDLAAFDSELIARTIAASPVPVLTGIGHEVDRSIADEVAHAAHKTPTAAAAAVVAHVRRFLDQIDEQWVHARRAALASATQADARLDRRADRVGRATRRSLARATGSLDAADRRTVFASTRVLDRADAGLDQLVALTVRRGPQAIGRSTRQLDTIGARLRAHDPGHALARGWTITTTVDGQPVRSVTDLAAGAELVTRFATGTVTSKVTVTNPVTGTTTVTAAHRAPEGAAPTASPSDSTPDPEDPDR